MQKDKKTLVNVVCAPVGSATYRCPCCKFKTLESRGHDDICPVCFWQDDGQDEHDAADIRGGPNKNLSLEQAQANYLEFGAASRSWTSNVRRPFPSEE